MDEFLEDAQEAYFEVTTFLEHLEEFEKRYRRLDEMGKKELKKMDDLAMSMAVSRWAVECDARLCKRKMAAMQGPIEAMAAEVSKRKRELECGKGEDSDCGATYEREEGVTEEGSPAKKRAKTAGDCNSGNEK